jgi:beta-lactam-binding protein with PASTA domain
MTWRCVWLLAACSVVAGCGSSEDRTAGSTGVDVPRVVGLRQSQAVCSLEAKGLRWRLGPHEPVRSHSAASCAGDSAAAPDPRIVKQSPRPEAHVGHGSVVTLVDECSSRPAGTGCA